MLFVLHVRLYDETNRAGGWAWWNERADQGGVHESEPHSAGTGAGGGGGGGVGGGAGAWMALPVVGLEQAAGVEVERILPVSDE